MKKWMKISGLMIVSVLLGIFLNSTLLGWIIRLLHLILFCTMIYLLSSSRKIQKQSESRK